MRSIFSKVFDDIRMPGFYSPRGKHLLYWGNLILAVSPALFTFIVAYALDGKQFGPPFYQELLTKFIGSVILGFFVFLLFRALFRFSYERSTPEIRMRLAIRAETSGDTDTLAQVLKVLEIDEINSWQFPWLMVDSSLSRLKESEFEEIRDALVILKRHENALRLKHTGDYAGRD